MNQSTDITYKHYLKLLFHFQYGITKLHPTFMALPNYTNAIEWTSERKQMLVERRLHPFFFKLTLNDNQEWYLTKSKNKKVVEFFNDESIFTLQLSFFCAKLESYSIIFLKECEYVKAGFKQIIWENDVKRKSQEEIAWWKTLYTKWEAYIAMFTDVMYAGKGSFIRYTDRSTPTLVLKHLLTKYENLFCLQFWRWSLLLYPQEMKYGVMNYELLEKIKAYSYSIANLEYTRTFVDQVLVMFIYTLITRQSLPSGFLTTLKKGKEEAIRRQMNWYQGSPICTSEFMAIADTYSEKMIKKMTPDDAVTYFMMS
jgi:hypothetical protein